MKVSDKLTKVNDAFTINMYDIGFMVEVGGRNSDDDWANAKVMVTNVDDLLALVKEVANMPRES